MTAAWIQALRSYFGPFVSIIVRALPSEEMWYSRPKERSVCFARGIFYIFEFRLAGVFVQLAIDISVRVGLENCGTERLSVAPVTQVRIRKDNIAFSPVQIDPMFAIVIPHTIQPIARGLQRSSKVFDLSA